MCDFKLYAVVYRVFMEKSVFLQNILQNEKNLR